MPIYTCECCNFKTNHKGNFERHKGTLKHHKNKKKNVEKRKNGVEKRKNGVEKRKNQEILSKYQCDCCNFSSFNKTDYERHLKSKRHNDIFQCVKIYVDKETKIQKKHEEFQEELEKTKEMLYNKDIIQNRTLQ